MIALARRIAALDSGEVRLLGRAWLHLARIRIWLSIRPWQRPRSVVDVRVRIVTVRPELSRLEWAIRAAARFVPQATCLTQALALQRLLVGFGYQAVVQVGVQHLEGEFVAHAWVEHNGRPLLGTTADIAQYSRFFTWPQSWIDRP